MNFIEKQFYMSFVEVITKNLRSNEKSTTLNSSLKNTSREPFPFIVRELIYFTW
jgi:hypothetical protein